MILTELDRLRREHPGWQITARWVTAATGPECRALEARRGDVILCALSAAELAEQISRAERAV